MIQQLLTDIGLSDKEADMYMILLRYGMQSTSFLAKKGNFNRGTAYVILHSLLEKGLVMQTTKDKIQYFSPVSPELLVKYVEHKEQELHFHKEKIQSMMGQFLAIQNPMTTKPKIEFFDGIEGARIVLEDTFTSNDKTLRAFLSIDDISAFTGPEYFDNYTTQRINKGYTLHVIRTHIKDKEALANNKYASRYVTSKKEKREVRYVSETLDFPISMYMYDNKLAIISSKEENFALLVKSRELSSMQKKIFDLLWDSLKKTSTKQ